MARSRRARTPATNYVRQAVQYVEPFINALDMVSRVHRSGRRFRPPSIPYRSLSVGDVPMVGRKSAASVRFADGHTKTTTKKKRKGSKKPKSKIKVLKKRVSRLEKNAPQDASRLVKHQSSSQVTGGVNVSVYSNVAMFYTTQYEQFMDNLRFIDRAATPAPTTINLTDQTYFHNVKMKDINLQFIGRNNNNLPCEVRVYWFKAVKATSNNPKDEMENLDAGYGITDSTTNVCSYPSDYPHLFKMWELIKTDKAKLSPGDEITSVYNQKYFNYDPKDRDYESSPTYMKGDIVVLVRLQGVVSHDVTTTSQVGFCETALDIVAKRKFRIVYPSDAAFKDIEFLTSFGAMAAGGEVAGPEIGDEKDTL